MKKLFLISIVFILSANCFAQDIHFSQYSQAPLIFNPALTAAFNGDIRVLVNYKDQWRSIGIPYKTYAFSYDMALFKKKWKNSYLGAGLFAFNDKAGDAELGTTQISLSLSGIVPLNINHKVSAGLQGSFAQRSLSNTSLRWGNQYNGNVFDPALSSGEINNDFNTFYFGDFSAGILWNYQKVETNIVAKDQLIANAGAALFKINKPEQKFYSYTAENLYSRLVLHADMYIGLKYSNIAVLPSILFIKQGLSTEFNFGGMLRYMIREESRYTGIIKESAVLFGCYYRLGDALIPSFMFEIANFAFGISYDINISSLKVASGGRGGIEISLRYINPNPFKYKSGKPMF